MKYKIVITYIVSNFLKVQKSVFFTENQEDISKFIDEILQKPGCIIGNITVRQNTNTQSQTDRIFQAY